MMTFSKSFTMFTINSMEISITNFTLEFIFFF